MWPDAMLRFNAVLKPAHRHLDEMLQELPGYKGQDIFARGVSPEQDAWFYLDELEAVIREWIAVIYHHSAHDSLTGLGVPGLTMTPAEMFAHGVARAGYLEVPRDPDLAYEFLPVVWRVIQHYGIDVGTRRYKGDIVAGRGCVASLLIS